MKVMSENEKCSGSFEIKKINASTLSEFNEKMKELTRESWKITGIAAIVVTHEPSEKEKQAEIAKWKWLEARVNSRGDRGKAEREEHTHCPTFRQRCRAWWAWNHDWIIFGSSLLVMTVLSAVLGWTK